MAREREPILWKSNLVGHIEDPKKWPALWRGRWVPANTPATEELLEALRKGRLVWVEYGRNVPKDMATIEKLPGEEIELRLSVDESKTLHVRKPPPTDLE